MKRFSILLAIGVLGASAPALAFEDDGQQCCGWRYGGDYSYSCGCYFGYEPGLADVVAGRVALAAATPFSPLIASTLAAPPMFGNYCVATAVTCLLPEPSWFGKECLCGYARGVVQ